MLKVKIVIAEVIRVSFIHFAGKAKTNHSKLINCKGKSTKVVSRGSGIFHPPTYNNNSKINILKKNWKNITFFDKIQIDLSERVKIKEFKVEMEN